MGADSNGGSGRMGVGVEDIVRHPLPGTCVPGAVTFSPDDRLVSFLWSPEGTLKRELHVCAVSAYARGGGGDGSNGHAGAGAGAGAAEGVRRLPMGGGVSEETLGLEERLRRERTRERGLGVTSYEWATGGRLVVPLPEGVHVQDGVDGALRLAVATRPGQPVLFPQLSPDGSLLAFVRDDEVHVVSLDPDGPVDGNGEPLVVAVTAGADGGRGVTHGLAEYIAQEEMDRSRGFWWAPDGRSIAFCRVDEGGVPLFRLMHSGKECVGKGAEEDHAYPFAGARNAVVALGIAKVPVEQFRMAKGSKGALSVDFAPLVPPPPPSSASASASAAGLAPAGAGRELSVVWADLVCGRQEGPECAGNAEEEYLARVAWMPDGTLTAQVQDRMQTQLKLVRFDPRTGARGVVLVESSDVWINLHDCFRPLKLGTPAEEAVASPPAMPEAGGPPAVTGVALSAAGAATKAKAGGGFVWASERSGWRHLYLHGANGECLGALTAGEWMVDSLVGVDEARGVCYVTGTRDGPLEKHLYACALWPEGPGCEPAAPRRVTRGAGRHTVQLDHGLSLFVDTHDSVDAPPRVTVCSLEDGAVLQTVHATATEATDPRLGTLDLRPPEFGTCPTDDGAEHLHLCVYRPDPAVHGPGPYPTVVAVYGGPHVQTVSNTWSATVDMRAQLLRGHGMLVLKVDNRGSARRGLAFEGAVRHRLGCLEVDDQVAGVRWAVAQGLADPARVSIYGWSYGGYISAMALCKAGHVFRAAVAGAPVTHWDGYDAHYTERYMGLPGLNPVGYREGSVMAHVGNLADHHKLMLVHGLVDENVHFRHTARLINALNRAGRRYELLLFPDERHMPRKAEDRMFLETSICDFLTAHVKGGSLN